MKQIPLTKGKVALVDDEDYHRLNQKKWYAHSMGYAVRNSPRSEGKKKILMHREVIAVPET